MLGDTDDMKAVRYDLCVWKKATDQTAVGTTQVNTHYFHSLPAFEPAQEGNEILGGFTGDNIEDAPLGEITEGGGETLLFMEGVFIDPEHSGTIEGDAFTRFTLGVLGVNPGYSGGSHFRDTAHVGAWNPLVVKSVKTLSKGLGTVSARKNTGQRFHKRTPTTTADISPALDL